MVAQFAIERRGAGLLVCREGQGAARAVDVDEAPGIDFAVPGLSAEGQFQRAGGIVGAEESADVIRLLIDDLKDRVEQLLVVVEDAQIDGELAQIEGRAVLQAY